MFKIYLKETTENESENAREQNMTLLCKTDRIPVTQSVSLASFYQKKVSVSVR